ncbi:hypothetical protein LTR84_010420 [Exophiala bonariae]|uniref:Cytochrome b561 domain-containing protein n=1 Tax=Exophiala bonariae TaxID=1690606 RepID=A0AAV9MWB2_9EURO|nr:hypothetical protein LTR84_010420 [Exophiala bonariae]
MRNVYLTSLIYGSLSVTLTNALSQVSSTATTVLSWPTSSSSTLISPTALPTEALTTAAETVPSSTAALIPTSPWTSGPFSSISWPPMGAGPPHWRPNWPATNGSGNLNQKPSHIPEWVFHIPKNIDPIRIAHAVLASCAFLFFFPFGGVMIRIWDPRVERYSSMVWAHAWVQGTGYIFFIATTGLGVYIAKHLHAVSGLFREPLRKFHPIIGLCIFALMALQPITELLNHSLHHRYPRIIYLGHVHVWLGRILITVGIINGGLGFRLADMIPGLQWPQWPKILYGALAGLIWIVYVAIIIVCDKFNQGEVQSEVRDEETGLGDLPTTTSPSLRLNPTATSDVKADEENASAAQGDEKAPNQEDRPRTSEEATVIFTRRSMKI